MGFGMPPCLSTQSTRTPNRSPVIVAVVRDSPDNIAQHHNAAMRWPRCQSRSMGSALPIGCLFKVVLLPREASGRDAV